VNPFSKVVLLVDDSATVRRMMEWALKSLGLRTLQAVDGLSALEVLKSRTVDLAIVDLNMPRMDGIELVRALRADERWKKLPVLLLTTEQRAEDRELARAAGVNAYLTKPADPEQLRRQVEALVGSAGPVGGGREATS
jgi:two-component system chemotaxis response regulator CheY